MRTMAVTQPEFQREVVHRSAWKAGVMGALDVAIRVISVRLVLLVAVAGGIALTWLCIAEPDPYRLGALGIYAGAIVVPLVWMATR